VAAAKKLQLVILQLISLAAAVRQWPGYALPPPAGVSPPAEYI
jgi:hypothetical protein